MVALPVSQQILRVRPQALCQDQRCFQLDGEHYVIEAQSDQTAPAQPSAGQGAAAG